MGSAQPFCLLFINRNSYRHFALPLCAGRSPIQPASYRRADVAPGRDRGFSGWNSTPELWLKWRQQGSRWLGSEPLVRSNHIDAAGGRRGAFGAVVAQVPRSPANSARIRDAHPQAAADRGPRLFVRPGPQFRDDRANAGGEECHGGRRPAAGCAAPVDVALAALEAVMVICKLPLERPTPISKDP